MATATDWWVIVPPSEQNAGKVPSDAVIISAQSGSSIDTSLLNTTTITYNGKSYVRYMGPFTSKAAAQAATPSTHLTIGDLVGLGVSAAEQAASGNAVVNPPNAAATDAVNNALGSTFSLIFGNTTGLLTRFLKVLIGGVLLIAGVMRLSGKEKDIIQMAGVAAKGAVFA